jgi:hypothetical protein
MSAMRSVRGLALVLLATAASALAGAGQAATGGDGSGPLVDGLPDQPATAVKAHVVLRCTVKADRSVDDCVVASESPSGQGLGEAALRISGQIRVSPETFGPDFVGEKVEIPINFERDPDPGDMPADVAAMPSP